MEKLGKFVLDLITLIRPKFHNKITWVVVLTGLALISTPLLEKIITIIIEKSFSIKLTGENDVALGFLLVVIGLFYHITTTKIYESVKKNERPETTKQLNQWRTTEETTKSLKSISNDHTNVKIIYFDSRNFPFSERLASAFKLSNWPVNFNKTAQGNHNPHYHGGIEIRGENRILVESIVSILESTGCAGVKGIIRETDIKPGQSKYDYAHHKIYITIGYEE